MSMLRSIRERKGMTVSQLAARAGVASRVIADYEEGRQAIALNHAKLLAKALWVGIEELLPPAGSAPPITTTSAQPQPQPQPRPTPSVGGPQAQTQVPSQPPTQSVRAATPTVASAPPPPPLPITRQEPGTTGMAAPRQEPGRAYRPAEGQRERGQQGGQGGEGRGQTTRPARHAPAPPSSISDGQMQELLQLAGRLEIKQEQLEERVGKALSLLNRMEAKDWIKRLRAMADELSPARKTRYGQWPEAQEDHEARYLREQQEAACLFAFKLFNGEQFRGAITDFTPYTITILEEGSGQEIVLRKLAIAYYRQASDSAPSAHNDGGEGMVGGEGEGEGE